MMGIENKDQLKSIKLRIEKLIGDGHLIEATNAIMLYMDKVEGDVEIYSMYAVILIMEGLLSEAEVVISEGLEKDSLNFDLIFNRAYIYELKGQYQDAADHYQLALKIAFTYEQQQIVNSSIDRILMTDVSITLKDKARIAFFVGKEMDEPLYDIIGELAKVFWIRKIVVNDVKQIENGMDWADLCWFEQFDDLMYYGSNLPIAQCKRIVYRIHSYETTLDNPKEINWENISKIVCTSSQLKQQLTNQLPGIANRIDMDVIGHGFSLENQVEHVTRLITDLISFRTALDSVRSIFTGKESAAELDCKDITVLIPCYNRGMLLKNDLDKDLKLGKQNKLIVDDGSTSEKDWLFLIEQNESRYRSKILYKQRNEGLAQSRWTGLYNIDSFYTAFVDDDDMLLCLDRNQCLNDIELLKDNYLLIVPRYVMNLAGGKLSIGYDRSCYNNRTAIEVLKEIASKSEIKAMLAGGSIGVTSILKEFSMAKEFKIGEDFVMLSRMFAAHPNMKVMTTESLVHIRRIADNNLSQNPSHFKLATSLLAQCIACYYCLYHKITDKHEVLGWMKERSEVIQKLYAYGDYFGTELIAYVSGEIKEDVFIHYLSLNGFRLFEDLDELAPELSKMRALFYIEPTINSLPEVATVLPLISIVIPTFNRKDLLKRTIGQVLKQDYPNMEVIVSDNCSEDGTDDMISSIYVDEVRLKYHKNVKNIGPVLNYQNALYHLVKGKYCIMISDDDYLIDSSYLSKAVKLLEENKDMAFVFSGYYYNHELKQISFRNIPDYPDMIDGNDFFLNFTMQKYRYMPNLCTTLFRTDNAKKVDILKNDPNCLAGDLSILLRLLLSGNAGFVNNIVLVYTLHKNSISINTEQTVISSQDKTQKVVESAIQDINEMKKISLLAKDKFTDNELFHWLKFRIWKYMYWRFNETVQTPAECMALAEFMLKNYPDLLNSLLEVIVRRFGEDIIKELVE